jgi:hypothetical protein
VAVAGDLASDLVKEREAIGGERMEGGLLDGLEVGAHVLFGGAVDARVGDTLFPVREMAVEIGESRDVAAFEAVVLYVLDAALDLALVPGRARPGGQDDEAVVARKGSKLRVWMRSRYGSQ